MKTKQTNILFPDYLKLGSVEMAAEQPLRSTYPLQTLTLKSVENWNKKILFKNSLNHNQPDQTFNPTL